MPDAAAFSAPNAKAFLKNLELLAGTTGKLEELTRVLSAVLHPISEPRARAALPA